MSTNNINSVDILKMIESNSGFQSSNGGKFTTEEANSLFVVGSSGNNGDTIVFGDKSGDQYSVSASTVQSTLGLTDEQLAELLGTADGNTEIKSDATAISLSEAEAAASTSTTDAEIEDLKDQKEANQEIMEQLKGQIVDLRKKVKEKIDEAIEKMEDISEEQKEKARQIVADKLAEYEEKKANGDENATPAQLSGDIAAALGSEGFSQAMQTSVSDLVQADVDLAMMDGLLSQLNTRIQLDKDLDSQIAAKEQEAKAAAETAVATQQKCCDPIGFQTNDGVQVDFFVDADGDNQINDVTDFLGAKDTEDGWNEMAELDGENGTKDGTIESEELAAADVKAMVTKADGTQVAMSMDEFEAEFGNLEINATKDAEIDTSVAGPKNFSDDEKNQMLGTYSLTLDGEDLKGYQTLDSVEWLDDNYKITNGIEGAPETIGAAAAQSGELSEMEEFAQKYTDEVMPQLEKEIQDAYAQISSEKVSWDANRQVLKSQGAIEASKIETEYAEKEQERIEELKAEREAEEAEEKDEAEEKAVAEAKAEVDDAVAGTGIENLDPGDENIWEEETAKA